MPQILDFTSFEAFDFLEFSPIFILDWSVNSNNFFNLNLDFDYSADYKYITVKISHSIGYRSFFRKFPLFYDSRIGN